MPRRLEPGITSRVHSITVRIRILQSASMKIPWQVHKITPHLMIIWLDTSKTMRCKEMLQQVSQSLRKLKITMDKYRDRVLLVQTKTKIKPRMRRSMMT